MQRVQTKESRDKETAPNTAGHSPEQQKKQHRISAMQQGAGQVVAPGLEVKQLAVEHVREPR